jgi:hypothetical protein
MIMKWCVRFPDEDILIKRPCLRKACVGNKSAAALLSFLLYQVSICQEFKKNIEHSHPQQDAGGAILDQKISINIHKTQRAIIDQMDYEISDRTLRDTAIPLLVALRYIDIDESEKANRYTVHLANIQAGINEPPTIQEFLPTLQHLMEDRNTSDKYRNYYRRLSAMLLTSAGSRSDAKNRSREARSADRKPDYTKDKKRKSNNDIRKILDGALKTDGSHNETMTSAAATKLSLEDCLVDNQQNKNVVIEIPQRPDVNASRTAETILQLIEFLRGQRFHEPERQRQAHAAAALIGLQPALSLKEIQEAWLHGSDEYWRKNHDPSGMTITDLAHHNSHGKRRVIAVLEHKRRQERERERTHRKSDPDTTSHLERSRLTSPIEPSRHESAMTEQDAQQLTQQVIQDGQKHMYNLQAHSAYEQNRWVVKVHFEHHIFTIHSQPEWARELSGIHEILQLRKKLNAVREEGISWIA